MQILVGCCARRATSGGSISGVGNAHVVNCKLQAHLPVLRDLGRKSLANIIFGTVRGSQVDTATWIVSVHPSCPVQCNKCWGFDLGGVHPLGEWGLLLHHNRLHDCRE